ncbi:di-heme-cytochrome C peroxidase [Beijerinckia sp. L45]|uniref:di-heme-cytochrome C peroxidase n=1 Tax=Beijerinckia sp. L45 TaxID=1641855 RepID=UPI001AEDE5D6|nr:di-heme-cytochrome C peroxidase [Beijerinckia sp. L45]
MKSSALLASAVMVAILGGHAHAAETAPTYMDQGPNWTAVTRGDFYKQDQGSKMIPLPWLQALQQPNGMPFLADHLGRYGYLANPDSPDGLPVGFTASGPAPVKIAGMTCSACHTRDITVAGTTYRVDGGPAFTDFQSFLADLDTAVSHILTDGPAFTTFANEVLAQTGANSEDATALHQEVQAWYLRYHTLVSKALPPKPWGPVRLDAVGMIFNRLTGLDLGPPPSCLIPENIHVADAPVRYPFLWNAPIQDRTQWPGFAANGNDLLALSRNLGEVYGVFGIFEPTKESWWHLLRINYLANNSANFDGLNTLETLVKKIGPPKWRWPVDPALVAAGKVVFDRPQATGGCVECHGIVKKSDPIFGNETWVTPVQNVGTDTREYDVLAWTAKTGTLDGASIPFLTAPLKATDKAFNTLALSVIGSILQYYIPIARLAVEDTRLKAIFDIKAKIAGDAKAIQLKSLPPNLRTLQGAFRAPGPKEKSLGTTTTAPGEAPVNAYESRVLEGIWAAAPYLHNGSVPTLSDLLKTAAERPVRFKIGPAYDIDKVGIAADQTKFDYTLETTDCSQPNSGDSRCGHEYGTTTLTADEKKALLEYLKTL